MLKIQEIQCAKNINILDAGKTVNLIGGGPFMTPNCPPPVTGGGISLNSSGGGNSFGAP